MTFPTLPDPLIDYGSIFRALVPVNALLVLTGFISAYSDAFRTAVRF